ncbi:MAG: glycosyl hydrolase [Blastopirellula sp.]|nr:MAG: glycosyl hydrolase [Blastopirellula sp.]
MLRLTLGLFALSLLTVHAAADDPNTLTSKESKAGFELLFNGKNLDGWKHSGNWVVEKGVMTREGRGGSLVYQTKKIPDNFELRFEWKVGSGSNSGIYYRPGQYEYQILDNSKHADGKNPRTSAASVYFCMAPSHDATNAPGEWNQGRIVCQGTVIQHWLNGEKVIDFDYTDKQWAWNVELLNNRGGNLAARGANLSLQDHGDPVWYRGIKLRKLGAEDKINHATVTPAEIPVDVLKAEKEKLDRILAARAKAAANKKK